MPTLTCPDCLAKFAAAGTRAVCPTCGGRAVAASVVATAVPARRTAPVAPVSARRPDDEDDRPSRRSARDRDDDDDDDEDDRPVKRRKKAKKAANNMLPVFIIGGAVAVLVLVGGVGFVAYRVLSSAKEVARATPTAPPSFTPPPFTPQPAVQPAPQPQPITPQPAMQPQPAPQPQPTPQPNPQPPMMGQQPPGGTAVTLSNLKRVFGPGPRESLEITIEYTAGAPIGPQDFIIIKTPKGTGEVDMLGIHWTRGTLKIQSFGFGFGKFPGPVEAWMERRTGGRLSGNGTRISNTVTLN